DPRQLDPRRRFELVTGDDRPDEHVDDRGRDPEMRERLLDDALIPDELVLSRASCGALIELVNGGQDPRLLRRLGMQDAFGRNGSRREARVRNSERLAFSRRLSLRNPLFATGAPRPLAGPPPRGAPRSLARPGPGAAPSPPSGQLLAL